MANVFQAATGYRDPQKAMTLKALEARAKAASEAVAQSMQPTVVADPMQGWAGILGTLGSQIQEGRAESAASAGRNRLAQLQAGITDYQNIDPNTLAQIGALDPEQQRFLQERMLEIQNREDTQSFQAGESQLEREQRQALQTQQNEFTGGQNALQRSSTESISELNRLADAARQKQADAAAAGRQDDQQAAAQELALLEQKITQQNEQNKVDIATGNIPVANAEREKEADRLGLKGTVREEYVTTGEYPAAGTTTNVYNTPGGKFNEESDKLAAQRLSEITKEGAAAKPFMAQLKIAADLGKQVGTGKWAELTQTFGPWLSAAGINVEGLSEGQAFQSIIDKLAPNMRVAGAGASSDFDARQFLSSLPAIGREPAGNALITATFDAIAQNKMAAAEIAEKAHRHVIDPLTGKEFTWTDAEAQIRALPDPYDTFKKWQAQSGTGGGGGGGGDIVDPNDPLGINKPAGG